MLAKAIVEAIKFDFTDRRGLGGEWDMIGRELQGEIVAKWERLTRQEIEKARGQASINVVIDTEGMAAFATEYIERRLSSLVDRLATVTKRQIGHTASGSQVCIGRYSPADAHWYVMIFDEYLMPDRRGTARTEAEAGLWGEDEAEGIAEGMVGR